MENYVLYDEIGRGESSVVYKGRKKGTIEFVAIHCVDKSKRLELRNMVRLSHDMADPNVVRFYEWYETTNHIWMVVELCTGYNLDVLLSQDKALPEQTVKDFATEIIKGLFYVHSLGIVYCDLKPSKILLDGPGHLKLSDFALSRVEGEENIFDLDLDDDDDDLDDIKNSRFPKPSPHYMAPEVLVGSTHSKASDLWSLGCVMFELYNGKQPFAADSMEELADKILGESCPPLSQVIDGKTVGGSKEFTDLINRLLVKDPPQRLNWSDLISHPFWSHDLDDLLEVINGYQSQDERTLQVKNDENQDILITGCDGVEDGMDERKVEMGESEDMDKIPIPGTEEVKQGTYTFKSLPKNVASKLKELNIEDKNNVAVPENHLRQEKVISKAENTETANKKSLKNSYSSTNESISNSTSHSIGLKTVSLSQKVRESRQNELEETSSLSISDLIFHPSDFVVSPIADNHKIKKFSTPKFDAKALCCQPLKAEEILNQSDEEIAAHFNTIETLFSPSQKSNSNASFIQRCKLHTSAYLLSICRNADIANLVLESGLIPVLLHQVKNGFSSELKARIGHCLGVLAGSATLISEDFHMTEVFTVLTEVIRDNFRNTQLKQHLVPALGEFLFYASTQEDTEDRQIVKWDAPGITFVIITRCLNEGEDIYVQHFAAKTIENVASTHGRHCAKFVNNDTAQLLWKLFTHCTVDNQKVTALSALCRLTCHSVTVFQYVVEKAGFKKVLDAFSSSISQVQQAMLTMFAALLSSKPQAKRTIQEKDLVSKVMRLFESPSPVIRGKALLLIISVIQGSREALLTCCQGRLVVHIEKDQKRGTPLKGEVPENQVYLLHCLHNCITSVVEVAMNILENVLTSLSAVEGRRHPSASHAKQLRTHLPNLPVVLHLITSHVFRSLIITDTFLSNLGSLLGHVKSIDCGDTNVGTAAGPTTAEDLTYVVLSVVECITQHPPLLLEYAAPISDHILPVLIEMVQSANGNTRVLCFRLFSEVASIYLDNSNVCSSASSVGSTMVVSTRKLKEIISEKLLPQYHIILQDQNPLPGYALKLLSSLMERCPDSLQALLDQDLVSSLLQIINSHSLEGNTSTTQTIIAVLRTVLVTKETDMAVLYQQGLVEAVKSLYSEVPSLQSDLSPEHDDTPTPILPLLDILYHVLKYVSKEVRYALHERSKGSTESDSLNQSAEVLLMNTKPIADVTGVLISFLGNEESKIQEGACKNLYLTAELFGGLYEESMSVSNVKYLAGALERPDDVMQKQLLRIIKRIISSNQNHCKAIVGHGQVLVDVLNRLASNSKVDAIKTLAREVLQKIGLQSPS